MLKISSILFLIDMTESTAASSIQGQVALTIARKSKNILRFWQNILKSLKQ
jgi:hypothetical protein